MALSNLRQRGTLSLTLLALGLAGCGGGGGGGDSSQTNKSGTIIQNLTTGLYVIVEPSKGGNGVTLDFAADPVWGRLVDIEAVEPSTGAKRTYFSDFLIGEDIVTGPNYTLTRNPVTGLEVLTIEHTFGTPAFEAAFDALEDGLQRFLDKGLSPNELPPFTQMPRNAALALRFDDLISASSVSAATILLETGYPPSTPFQARIFPDPNHGDIINGKFHSTRVIIDMSVSQADAQVSGIAPNPIGLPEAIGLNEPNVAVRIPTILNAGATQFELLTNLSDHGMSFGGNGSTLSTSPTLDVVRAFRSGGRFENTGDSYNGFLRDDEAPEVLGALGVSVTLVAPVGTDYDLDLIYEAPACALTPRVGDLVVLSGAILQVIVPGNAPGGFGSVTGVRCELISGNPAAVAPGIGQYRAPWDSSVPVVPECFVRFTPKPQTSPASGVQNDAGVQIGFTEPMYPNSLSSFDGFVVQKGTGGAQPFDNNVVAIVTPGLDLQDYTFDPLVPFDHISGQTELYSVQLEPGVTDLAGNRITETLPRTSFSIQSTSPTTTSGGFAFTFSNGVTGFNSANVDDNADGKPDFRGQFIYDPLRGEIRPRSVERFSGVADGDRCNVSAMVTPGTIVVTSAGTITVMPIGAIEPLSPHGSRTMSMWRYFDLGLSLLDEATFNIDVEGLSWSPFTQGLSLDFFSQFQISLAHCLYLPDEANVGFPQNPTTGLSNVFDANLLDSTADPLEVVHERSEGYLIQPLDQFQAASGLLMAPWPLNHNKALEDFKYYTWRDTSLTALGAPNGFGADPDVLGDPALAAGGLGCPEGVWSEYFDPNGPLTPLPTWIAGGQYAGGLVPSIGLPLLMDFRNYPDSTAGGLNLLSYRLGTGFGLPVMRLQSTGAQLPGGPIVQVNPDQEISAQGSFDVNGMPTPGVDDGFYLGQADFVVRVNRVHSYWLDAGIASNWEPAVILPNILDQPSGTMVSVAYRGATSLNFTSPVDPLSADQYNPYGDISNSAAGSLGVFFLNNDSSWHTDINDLDGARLVQVRITLTSNVESSVEPTITDLGMSYSN